MKIYRYRKMSLNTIKELINEELWFSGYIYLNDPFECAYQNNANSEHVNNMLSTFHLCSFSKINHNLLMWAHYADSHKGICLEFDVDEDYYKKTFFEVEYSNQKPALDEVRYHQDGTLKIATDVEGLIFRTKSMDWEYEEEVRTIRIDEKNATESGSLQEYPGKLTGVFFGLDGKENIKYLNKVLSNDNDVVFYESSLSDKTYQLLFKKLDRNEIS